ncbi:uncharacterized protein N0V89_012369 [Didymosphaeria variabile]|uniref:DSBA-like thioredoxin domain-containing protein n=1 Tax=Didymosphaeria variabile TaxID=1932322 RepID=A0A9W9C629_9PLEO|nr:uncharacterized protein N0V89_012369 [Didymosphaeria variabile]KAJ4344625.1 hypothetical protein N0V89_012369 [Didymosphaeria variabile]
MSIPKITLFVDIVSPFAYIAFYALHNFPAFKQCDITYVPVFLGDKDKWINTERIRWSNYLNVPVSQSSPPGFPTNTISIQRVLTAISLSHPASLPSALSLFWQNYWVHWNDPSTPENLLAIVSTIVGGEEEARRVIEASKGKEVKEKLTENTEWAVREEAFGLPWFLGECDCCCVVRQ